MIFKFLAFQGLVLLVALFLFTSNNQAETKSPLPVIDAHVHLDFEESPEVEKLTGFKATLQEFLLQAKAAGVVAFVAHTPSEKTELPSVRGPTPTFCVGIQEDFDIKVIEQGLRSQRYRCIKIYLGYVHRYAYDKLYLPLYPLAEKYNVPVVFHTGDTDSPKAKLKYADPLTVDEVAVDFPKVNFVLAHMGNPWIQSASEVAYKNPNVYMDSSALAIGSLKKMKQYDLQKFILDPLQWALGYTESPEKLMFGTDWPLLNIKEYKEATLRAIPPEFHRAYLYENAAKVFGIKVQR